MDITYYRVRESYYTVVGVRKNKKNEGAIVALRTEDELFSLKFSKVLFGCIDDNITLIKSFLIENDRFIQENEIHFEKVPYDNLSSEEKYWFKIAFERIIENQLDK